MLLECFKLKGSFLFGYIRFVLAYFVVLSHMNYTFFGKNIGVFAVVIFYIIAGLVTSKIIIKISPYNIKYFAIDRFLRIYPAFFTVSSLALIFLMLTNYSEFEFNLFHILLNFLLIPLNYFYFIDLSVINAPVGLNFVLPPAWSLGAEVQAYLVLVFSIFYKKLGILLAMISLLIFVIANLNILHPDIFGYRLIFGVFFMFYTGFLIYQNKIKTVILFCSIVFIMLLYVLIADKIYFFSVEISLGYLIGVIIISMHERLKIKLPFNNIFGSLSYILFLSHFLGIWSCRYIFGKDNLFAVTVISIFISLLVYFICERPITKYRLSRN
ncbi:acyltransferase family protein [Campylobacter fetus]|uniref:acyltransferase family protein n=1 Tax=Campylobacter fetus TaxID=196 RepID=UPI000AE626D3|nr:acyltransferase [Campylobacter fetus]QYA61161.1 acyltransferase [Campylobacter fetus subsp. fetus]QYA64638.1 acyltransferase [Campylobacter fetus subsp. fetus]SQH29864.1 Uncharacterised protein [Campylobacter fetus subsp. fetus]